MKKMVKGFPLLAGAAAIAIISSGSAFACGYDEVCGLDLNTNINTDSNIGGMGDLKLSNVDIMPHGHINVQLPSRTLSNAFEFAQTSKGNITSNLNYTGDRVQGNFKADVSSIANNASFKTFDGLALEGVQNNSGNIYANSRLNMWHMTGLDSIDLNVTSVANNTSVDTSGDLVVDLIQNNTGRSVFANADVNLNTNGTLKSNLDLEVAAIGNNFGGKIDGDLIGSTIQENCADVTATANVNLRGMYDPIKITSVGNNISIDRR